MRTPKESTKGTIWKRLLILFLSILTLFALINGVWYFGYQKRYNTIAEHLNEYYAMGIEEPEMRRYGKEVDEYQISMKMPAYLGTGGFVSVGPREITVDVDEDGTQYGEPTFGLFIYPKWFSGFQLVVGVNNAVTGEAYFISVTPNLDLTQEFEEALDPEEAEQWRQLIAEHLDDIKKMIAIAEKTLEIELVRD